MIMMISRFSAEESDKEASDIELDTTGDEPESPNEFESTVHDDATGSD